MTESNGFRLRQLDVELAILQLDPRAAWPEWAQTSRFCSMTRTDSELSLVVESAVVPPGLVHCQPGWRAIGICGPLPFDLVGVLRRLLDPLATAGIPIFSISTYDTDWILVDDERLATARQALWSAGFRWVDEEAGGEVRSG